MLYSTLTRVLLLSFGASVIQASPSPHLAANQPHITWGPCNPSVVNDTALSCGFLDVPLDYHDPSVGTARLALVKANATGERRGSMFMNPGGPGGSGIVSVNQNRAMLLALTGGIYDIISWDPRGVGLTLPGDVHCFDSVEEYSTFFEGTIELTGIEETGNFTDPADIDALLAQADVMQQKYEKVGQKCLGSPSGKFLKYMGTAAAVRDMVTMADVLDGPGAPVNYIGFSYGTLIGSWFVNMFPDRVGRVVLDGVLDPMFFATRELATNWVASQLVDADTVYKGLVTGCALSGPAGCAAASEGDTPLEVDAKFQALLVAAHDAARKNASVPLTSGQIRSQLYPSMFFPQTWSFLVNDVYPQLVGIVTGESQELVSPAKRRDRLSGTPLISRAAGDTRSYTSLAIFCGDGVDTHGTTVKDVFQSVIDGAQNVSHLFGAFWPGAVSQCSSWPVRAIERYEGPFNKKLANKILIASTTYDPITPLSGARVLARLLGEDAALVEVNGFGHTTVAAPSTCVNAIALAYLINGTLPVNGTVCDVDADFEVFQGVNTASILAHLPSADV